MKREIPGRAVHGGTILSHRRRSGQPLLDFSANLNPFPPEIPWNPNPSSLASYPDDRYEALREVIGRLFHRAPGEIAVGNGSMEIIRVFCQAVLSDGDSFHVEHPTFGEYRALGTAGRGISGGGSGLRAGEVHLQPQQPDRITTPRSRTEGHPATGRFRSRHPLP